MVLQRWLRSALEDSGLTFRLEPLPSKHNWHLTTWDAHSAKAMLYKFKSKAAGDVIMTGPVGDKVLRAMGREPATKGIFETSALLSLIATLEAAIADDEASRKNREPAEADTEDGPAAHEALSLRQRAWPLVDLMRRALAEKVDVVWGV